jgi:hypothetical protein
MSNNFGEIVFGAGTAILTPFGANAPANPTPLNLPIMQELSINWNGDVAELYGQDQYSYAQARTKVKIECTAKIGAIYGALLSDLFFGATLSVGSQILFAIQESNTVTSHSATVAQSAHFLQDMGVINAATGQPYRTYPSAPAVGGYSVSAGVYTFNAADTIATALISYTYAGTSSTTGATATITNKPMGAMPTFNLKYLNNQFGHNVYLEFFNAIATKIGLPNKNTEFEMVDFSFTAFSSTNGNVFELSLDE